MKERTHESVRIPAPLVRHLKAYKKATGVPIGVFIEDAVNKKLDKLPKKLKEKMVQYDPTLVFHIKT